MAAVLFLGALAAFGLTIMNAIGKCPVWVPMVVFSIVLLLMTVNAGLAALHG